VTTGVQTKAVAAIRLPSQHNGRTWVLEIEKGAELAEPQVILRTWAHDVRIRMTLAWLEAALDELRAEADEMLGIRQGEGGC
jgi:hypothetical protein